MTEFFVNTYIKMFFLLAPFFTMTIFLKMAEEMPSADRQRAALRASSSILVAVSIFFFFGRPGPPLGLRGRSNRRARPVLTSVRRPLPRSPTHSLTPNFVERRAGYTHHGRVGESGREGLGNDVT
jgi:hypothetical protein